MKKYFAPELETAEFAVMNVIALSTESAKIIGGDDNPGPDDTSDDYAGVVYFDWAQANWN